MGWSRTPISPHPCSPLEVLPTLDDDLWYAASMVVENHDLKRRRQASIGRWAPVSKHLVAFQSEAIRGVTSKRDLGLLGLFVVLMQWGDFALPHGFIKGLPAVGYAPSPTSPSRRSPARRCWLVGRSTTPPPSQECGWVPRSPSFLSSPQRTTRRGFAPPL